MNEINKYPTKSPSIRHDKTLFSIIISGKEIAVMLISITSVVPNGTPFNKST